MRPGIEASRVRNITFARAVFVMKSQSAHYSTQDELDPYFIQNKERHSSSTSSTFWVVFLLVQASFLVCLASLLSIGYTDNLPRCCMKDDSDWGANVTIDGHTVSVLSWFDDQLKSDNIKNNLQ